MDNSVRENIYRILNELIEDEFKEFKWQLQGINYDRIPSIPRGQLQDADKTSVVDLMIQNYDEEVALKVCIQVLQKSNKNNLAARLEEITPKDSVPEQMPGASDYRGYIQEMFSTIEEHNSRPGEYVHLSERYSKLIIIDYPRADKCREHEILASGRKHVEIMNTRENLSVTIEALFNPDQHGRIPQVVVLQGAAGIGKTMTARKIMLDWASQQLYQDMFDYVFYIYCREMNVYADKEERSLGEIISEQWPYGHAIKKTIDAILRNPKKLLFIIDGFDELRFSFEQPKKCLCTDPWKKASIAVLLSSLFQKKVLPDSYLIITTRPTALEKLHQCLKRPRYVEILGFSVKERREYFHNFFGNKDQAFQVLTFVEQNDTLFTMCVIPLVCWIICTVMEQEMEREEGLQQTPYTLTAVYTLYLSSLLKFHHQESNQDIQRILKGLCSLAAEGIWKQQILFTEEDLQRHSLDQEDSLSVFLNENIFKKDIQRIHIFSFIHLSFQEFFAALSYVLEEHEKSCSENLNENLGMLLESSLISSFDLTVTVRFLFGLLNEEKRMKQFKKRLGWKISPKIKEFLLSWVKNISKHKTDKNQEILQNLYEMQDGNFVKNALEDMTLLYYFYNSENELMMLMYCLQYCRNLKILHIFGTFGIYKKDTERELFSAENLSNSLMEQRIKESNGRHLLEVLRENQSLRELEISSCDIGEKGIEMLCEGLKHPASKLQKLRLLWESMTESSCKHLAEVLRQNQNLRELDLAFKKTDEKEMELLCEGLKHPDCKLQTLSLSWESMAESSCRHLAEVFRQNQSLTELFVTFKNTDEKEMELLHEGLKHPDCKLQTLRLSWTSMTEFSCRRLAEVVRENQSLRELVICSWDIDEKGIELLSEELRHPACKLQTLRLSWESMAESSCRHLAEVLRQNQSLRELEIFSSGIDEKGIKLLCEALKYPACKLQTLSLSWESKAESSCRLFAEQLRENQSVKEFAISAFGIDEKGMELLCEGLKHPACKLQTLCVLLESMIESSCRHPAEGIGENQSPTELFHEVKNTDEKGIEPLCEGLKQRACELHTLRESMAESSCRHLAEVLRENQSLTELFLEFKNTDEKGLELLCEGLRHPACKLQTLRLSWESMTESSCRHLAEVLRENQSLRELDLIFEDQHENGIKLLCDGFKHPNCKVQKLRINKRVVEINCKDDVGTGTNKAENKEPETRKDKSCVIN